MGLIYLFFLFWYTASWDERGQQWYHIIWIVFFRKKSVIKKTRLCKQENIIHNLAHNNTEYLGFCSQGQYIYLQTYTSNSTCPNRVYFKMFVENNQRRLRHVNRPTRGRWEKRSKPIFYRSATGETSDGSHSRRYSGGRTAITRNAGKYRESLLWLRRGKMSVKVSFLDAFAKWRKASVRPSVHTPRTTRLPLEGFSLNLIFEDFFFQNLSRKFKLY